MAMKNLNSYFCILQKFHIIYSKKKRVRFLSSPFSIFRKQHKVMSTDSHHSHSISPNPNPNSNIEQFKHETFSLIKQQATKLKSNTKQLQIKQQQIRLLKQTISVLEDERDAAEKGKEGLRMKIDLIMRQVANYNDNVVSKLHEDNEMLNRKVSELMGNLEESLDSMRKLGKQLENSQAKYNQMLNEFNSAKETKVQIQKTNDRLKQQNTKLKQQQQSQDKQIHRLEAENQQLTAKSKSNEKQIETLINKCQESINTYEKKIKSIKENYVKKQQMQKLVEELQKVNAKIEEIRKEKDRLAREKNELGLNAKIMKEKEIAYLMKGESEGAMVDADLRILKDSIKIGKKVTQFQSKYSSIFYQIFEQYQNTFNTKQQLQQKLQNLQQSHTNLQSQLTQKQTQLEQQALQFQLLSQKIKKQSQSIQSSYEGKILQLSIKIKKQQKALQQLRIKDQQFNVLNEQYQKLCEQNNCMKQSLQNTIEQYKKQNQSLSNQVQELVQLCDQNITTKNSLNTLKYTINDLLAVVYFLYLNILRNKEIRRKIYMPFVQFYFGTRRQLMQSKEQSGSKTQSHYIQKQDRKAIRDRKLRKFRSCVNVIIALIRMRAGASQVSGAGLLRYAERAIKHKSKIDNLAQYLDKLLQKLLKNERTTADLLKQNKNMYRWHCVHNYMKVNIPVNWWRGKLMQ